MLSDEEARKLAYLGVKKLKTGLTTNQECDEYDYLNLKRMGLK